MLSASKQKIKNELATNNKTQIRNQQPTTRKPKNNKQKQQTTINSIRKIKQ